VVAQNYNIGDLGLADAGLKRIDRALSEMPVMAGLIEELAATRPLDGLRIGGCPHIAAETASPARALIGAGADLARRCLTAEPSRSRSGGHFGRPRQ